VRAGIEPWVLTTKHSRHPTNRQGKPPDLMRAAFLADKRPAWTSAYSESGAMRVADAGHERSYEMITLTNRAPEETCAGSHHAARFF
jgi:hypothetical protein